MYQIIFTHGQMNIYVRIAYQNVNNAKNVKNGMKTLEMGYVESVVISKQTINIIEKTFLRRHI